MGRRRSLSSATCGSRWRTNGTLANYTPLHARSEAEESEDHRAQKIKSMSLNKNREGKMVKRKADQQDDAFMRKVSSETIRASRKREMRMLAIDRVPGRLYQTRRAVERLGARGWERVPGRLYH